MPAPYLQAPPATREGSAWFYCANGAKSLATALDVYETPADRHQRDLDMTPNPTTGIPAAVERYDLLHESVLGRKPAG